MSKFDFYDSEIFVDYYETLNIDSNASKEDIKQSYISLVKKYHPDHDGGSEALFRKVNEAYELLSKDENRKEYDAYYIKKNTDIFNKDDFIRFKHEHEYYIEDNKKDLSEDDIEKLYNDVILSIQQQNKLVTDNQIMKPEDMFNKIDDIQYERKNAENDESNNKLNNLLYEMNSNILPGENKYTVSDLFDFYKNKKYQNNTTNTQLINNNFMTLNEINDPNDMQFSFVNDNIHNLNNSFHSFYNEQHNIDKTDVEHFIKTIDTNEFSEWYLNKGVETKITKNDFETLLQNRRNIETEIDHQVEQNLVKHKAVMNLVDDGEKYVDNLNFFQDYNNPFEDDLYGAIEQNIDNLNNVNDIENISGEFDINNTDIDDILPELKSFIKKTNKSKHETKETNINNDDISNLINDRNNIDNLVFCNDVPKKHQNINVSNVIKRNSKSDNSSFNELHNIDMKKYEILSSTNSRFKDLTKANLNNKIQKNLNLNLEEDLGNINDFYE
jgi:curved DNA-binding protein CbpA